MSSLKIVTAILIVCGLSACALFDPFVDRRRNAGAQDISHLYVGKSKINAPAICYNGLWTDEQTLQNMADDECQKHNTGTHAIKTHKTSFSCKLFLPSHAYYKCVD